MTQSYAQDMEQMTKSLSCRELAEKYIGGGLGKSLARLGAALDRDLQRQEREYHLDPQPLLNSFLKNTFEVGLGREPIKPIAGIGGWWPVR